MGFAAVLSKPWQPSALASAVRWAFAQSPPAAPAELR